MAVSLSPTTATLSLCSAGCGKSAANCFFWAITPDCFNTNCRSCLETGLQQGLQGL